MGKCSVKFGNKSNGIVFEYAKGYEETLAVYLTSSSSRVKADDFCLNARYEEDEGFFAKLENLTENSNIAYDFAGECFLNININLQKQTIKISCIRWDEQEREEEIEVYYTLKPADIKKLFKFVKEMKELQK